MSQEVNQKRSQPRKSEASTGPSSGEAAKSLKETLTKIDDILARIDVLEDKANRLVIEVRSATGHMVWPDAEDYKKQGG